MSETDLVALLRDLPRTAPPDSTALVERALTERGDVARAERGRRAVAAAGMAALAGLAGARLARGEAPSAGDRRLVEIAETVSAPVGRGLARLVPR